MKLIINKEIQNARELHEEGHSREIIKDSINQNLVSNWVDEIDDEAGNSAAEFEDIQYELVDIIMDVYDQDIA